MMNKSLLTGAVALLAMGVVSCSSNPPPQQASATPPPPATTPPPPTPVNTPCDAGQVAQITTQFAGRTGTEAPKMEAEGPLLCMNVPEGGQAESADFTMYPGYCYTVLGTGLPSVQTTALQVTLDPAAAGFPPALAAFVAVPVMTDNSPTLMTQASAGKDCYKYALPFPGMVKLTVKAKVGQGPIAAQVYKRELAANEMPAGVLGVPAAH